MKKYLLLMSLLLCLSVSCDDSGIDSSIITPDKVEEKVYFAGSIPTYIKDALKHYMPYSTSNIAEAKVVVGSSADLLSIKADIADFWKAGGITVEIHPEYSSHEELWDYAGPGAFLPQDSGHDAFLLIAVHNYGSYRITNPLKLFEDVPQDEEIEEDELASPSDEVFEDDDTNEGDAIEATGEYFKTRLEGFANWVLKHLATQGVQDSKESNSNAELVDRIDKLIHRDDCSQIESGVLDIGAKDYQLCKIASSKPDKITRSSTYEYEVTITPFYAFAEGGRNAADYYFVTATFVSHNYPLFGTYKKRHGAIPTVAHAFYSENINWEATLETGNTKYKVSLPEIPTPQTTVGQMKYTSGFSSTLNVTGQIGFTGPAPSGMLTVGGTFTWNNATDITFSDQTINSSYDPKTGKVRYEYKGLNHLKNDNPEKAVPQILKASQVCTSSWCWKVDGVSDNETKQFTMKINTDPLYGYMYRHCTWGAEGHLKHNVHLLPESDRTISITVKNPNRTPTGIIQMECTSKYRIKNVKVYDSKNVNKAHSDGSYKKDYLLRYQLPAGTYYITFDVENPDADDPSKKIIGKYKLSGIQVTAGKTIETQSDKASKQSS